MNNFIEREKLRERMIERVVVVVVVVRYRLIRVFGAELFPPSVVSNA